MCVLSSGLLASAVTVQIFPLENIAAARFVDIVEDVFDQGRDIATLRKCEELNITYSAYSPLGGLSGVNVLGNPTVLGIGKAHNKTSAQVALRWVTQQGVVAVTASNKSSYDKEDLDIYDFTLSDAEMTALSAI